MPVASGLEPVGFYRPIPTGFRMSDRLLVGSVQTPLNSRWLSLLDYG
ncbi:hypothetical protein [Oscillatoria sp. HE19RPO]|nr:hypothetical protein [Oscillatoria sp. HE19RPO]